MSEMDEQARDLAAAALGHKMAVGGGTGAVIFGLAASDFAAIAGVVIAVIGLCIQFYYKRRADRRDAELHAAQMADLRRNG